MGHLRWLLSCWCSGFQVLIFMISLLLTQSIKMGWNIVIGSWMLLMIGWGLLHRLLKVAALVSRMFWLHFLYNGRKWRCVVHLYICHCCWQSAERMTVGGNICRGVTNLMERSGCVQPLVQLVLILLQVTVNWPVPASTSHTSCFLFNSDVAQDMTGNLCFGSWKMESHTSQNEGFFQFYYIHKLLIFRIQFNPGLFYL